MFIGSYTLQAPSLHGPEFVGKKFCFLTQGRRIEKALMEKDGKTYKIDLVRLGGEMFTAAGDSRRLLVGTFDPSASSEGTILIPLDMFPEAIRNSPEALERVRKALQDPVFTVDGLVELAFL